MQIRPARPRDLEVCAALDHSYRTDRVWQMEVREEADQVTAAFREANLPREMQVEYPRQGDALLAGWRRRDGFLVAVAEGTLCGYVALTEDIEHGVALVGDLVVDRPWRRRGLGTALVLAAGQWGRNEGLGWLQIEVQTKNYPAVRLCRSRGMLFCGYNDHYWPCRDIAVFFGESLR